MWGWNADYPDPENFLFLLYGPNAKSRCAAAKMPRITKIPSSIALFERMKDMDNGPQRQAVIDEMIDILRHDAPWVWGFHPKGFSLFHAWYRNVKPNLMANNTLKYKRIDPEQRERKRAEWNPPILWPVYALLGVLLLSVIPAVIAYRRRERGRGR
jgi:oligopeptide transport system substrate-binding protein